MKPARKTGRAAGKRQEDCNTSESATRPSTRQTRKAAPKQAKAATKSKARK